jgi:hypothetical protein
MDSFGDGVALFSQSHLPLGDIRQRTVHQQRALKHGDSPLESHAREILRPDG